MFRTSCTFTGLVYIVGIPGLQNLEKTALYFEIKSPLAERANVQKLLGQGRKVLSTFPKEVLAGLCLSLYRHHGLFELHKTSASQANLLLSSCPPALLIDLLLAGKDLSPAALRALPAFSFELHKDPAADKAPFECFMAEFLSKVRAFGLPENPNRIAIKRIESRLGKFEVPKDQTQAFLKDEAFITESITEGRALLSELVEDEVLKNPKVIAILKEALRKRNLLTLNEGLKEKLSTGLASLPDNRAQRLADILEATYNPYDPLGEDEALPSVSIFDTIEDLAKPKKNPLELLKAKLAGKAL